ncbi:MAG: CHASE2 domain-containing protein [Lachnospiraceae bacterium]
MKTKLTFNKLKSFLPILILALITAGMIILQFPKEPEVLAEDTFYRHEDVIPNQIKLITIDEETLAELGPYSDWDRTYFAELIQRLNENPEKKPKVIGIDVIFSGTGNSEADAELVSAAKNAGNVILASKLDTGSRVVYSAEEDKYFLQHYIENEITAFDELNSVTDSGFTNLIFDDDGYIRRAYTYVETDEKTYKSFSYLLAERMCENPDDLRNYPSVIEFTYTGKPGDFETIPMSKVLNGTVPADYFADSVVLVGAYEEGMLDSYRVPIDHSGAMYGVECQANIIWALVNGKQVYTVPVWVQVLSAVLIITGFGLIMRKSRVRLWLLTMLALLIVYPLVAFVLFRISAYKLFLLYIPVGIVLEFFVFLIIRYIELQKQRAEEMQKMLFSMADSMAEAIEGRTPYNANHTKNVADRCIIMLDYINQMHKENKTEMHFSDNDKKQMYLAAMLHDVGKMDIPLEVMDKPTKLGHLEQPLRSRLEMIILHIEKDTLSGRTNKEESEKEIRRIRQFLEKLDGFNCGRPLKEDEIAFINEMSAASYKTDNGDVLPYLTEEELNDLRIKAGTLSDEERKIMQSHVEYTDKILGRMYFGGDYQDVRRIATNHHELLNGRGYPNGIGAEQLDVMTRILTIMDIFDSLIADDRPYKKPKPVKVAFNILDEEAEAGKVDKDLLAIAKEIWLQEPKVDAQKPGEKSN